MPKTLNINIYFMNLHGDIPFINTDTKAITILTSVIFNNLIIHTFYFT